MYKLQAQQRSSKAEPAGGEEDAVDAAEGRHGHEDRDHEGEVTVHALSKSLKKMFFPL